MRNLISQQDGIKAAFFGFQDRYRGLPGDYSAAGTNINCPGTCPGGNGNGRIENTSRQREDIYAWTHLAAAGFINGSYSATIGVATQDATNTPTNPYSQMVSLIYDACWGNIASCAPAPTSGLKHNLKTGSQVPSEILAEVDRKIDDGLATGGSFRFSTMTGLTTGTAPTGGGSCYNAGTGHWIVTGTVQTNCAGMSLF